MTTEKTYDLTNIRVKTFTTSDGDILVDKIVFEAPDAPEQQVTWKPRKQETVRDEVAGVTREETNTVRYTIPEWAADFEVIKEAQNALENGEERQLRAQISQFDQSEDDSVEGNKLYEYIPRNQSENIELLAP